MPHCPLCTSISLHEFYQDNRRSYWQCSICELVNVPAQYHLSPADEKREYDKHENNSDDPGYRRFLSRTFNPLALRLSSSSCLNSGAAPKGLDFGCGPGPAISEMARERGYEVSNYDLYYYNQPELLTRQYDFVTMTEALEHIADPKSLVNLLDSLLKQVAILAIMTKRVTGPEAFSRWHYKNDPTHICFYSLATFEWISHQLGWQLEVIDKDVVFFHKDQTFPID